ncbi:MAG TPA: glycine zipper 2TM domain-containing protein [Rudaea sp.]|jgi:uncharacterized protein YcfJ
MRKIGVLVAVTTLLFCGLLAQAQEPHPAPAAATPEVVHYGWADVLRVDPVYDDAGPVPAAAQPREECYEEQVEQAPTADSRAGGTVLGAIIGGLVGHAFGKGNGRAATTAVGVVAGAAVGNSAAAPPAAGAPVHSERHCRIVDNPAGQRHIVAYDVEYRYRGERYTARMNYDPGDRIRVRISVTPAE